MARFLKFSSLFLSASGLYGIVLLPSMIPNPAGSAPIAPAATTGPACAEWSSRSQLAVFMDCHMPLKFGFPSEVRGMP